MDGSVLTPWDAPAGHASSEQGLVHGVDRRNDFFSVGKRQDGGAQTSVVHVTNSRGQLLFDGELVYDYDAWGRLILISRGEIAGGLPNNNGGEGPVFEEEPHAGLFTRDQVLKEFTYDALGRLVRVQSPYPTIGEGNANGTRRSERLFYDGVRRVYEETVDPQAEMGLALSGGAGEESQQAAEEVEQDLDGEVDEGASPAGYEAQLLMESNSGGGGGTIENPPVPTIPNRVLEREYVWGPGDNGVDELFVQYDGAGTPWYSLHDPSGDLVALCELHEGSPRVVAQWTWDAYGNVISADYLHPHPFVRLGHKGLFAERLDADLLVDDGNSGYEENPRAVPYAQLLYHVRNRTLSPGLGRWLQRDPNATGQPVLGIAAHHAGPFWQNIAKPNFDVHFRDGLNVHAYVRSDPIDAMDALGLEYSYVNVQFASGQSAGMQSAQYTTYGTMMATGVESSGMLFGGASIGSVFGFSFGGASGSFVGAKALAVYLLTAAIVATPTVVMMAADGSDQPGGQPLPGESMTVRPRLTQNPKHHANSRSPEPKDAASVYANSITIDGGRTYWGLSPTGEVYRYNGNPVHWSGRSGDGVGLRISSEVWRALGQSGPPPSRR